MKQKNILFIFLVTLSAVFACERVDESQLEGSSPAVEKVEMTFSAVIDGEDARTKTVLGGKLGDDLRKVLWQPGDKIGVSAETVSSWGNELSDVSEFTANITSNAESSEFKGGVELGARYKAFYPYQVETLRDSADIFIFNLPAEQKYVNGSFDPNAAPMVASARAGETFRFRNLCGVLALQVKGEGAVKSITFKPVTDPGDVVLVAGDYEVNPFFEDAPVISYHGKGSKSVTLSCDIPVELDPEQATPFYIVLPPAVYDSFTVLITLEDGRVMIKEGNNPLTVKRADVVAAGALTYVENLPVDLSSHGTANSYIVSEAGLYSFDASVIGNGEFGLIEGADFHTDNPTISPEKVELLWEDRDGVIDGLSYDVPHKRISFIASGREGNALVAAKDADDNILWSWHIWATDEPVDQNYVNNVDKFTVMDRNLGAIRNDRGEGEEWKDARGLVYQWGRKDPFAPNNYISGRYEAQRDYNKVDIADAIANPMVFKGTDYENWEQNDNGYLWTVSQKTIYDPCPVGYKVPTADIWDGFIRDGRDAVWNEWPNYNINGSFNSGWDFYYNDSEYTYYPSTLWLNSSCYWEPYTDENSFLWSAEDSDDSNRAFHLYAHSYADQSSILLHQPNDKSWAFEVRCMKDENHVDVAYPVVTITEVSDVTENAAKVYASIEPDDASNVTERGVIWGTEIGLTKENGNVVPSTSSMDQFSVSLSGLNNATKYYVRAYATNEKGTGYSKETSFYTKFSGDPVNLSEKGTSNSYIVRPIHGEYYFDASVKGNSEESVGQIASVELLWETRNTANNIKAGSVVTSVELKGTDVHFQLPPDVKPGNALIAVKDALGTIRWSWHIWVVDFDPVETQHTYISGAVMMDRNMGALKVKGDVTANGLIYYWGRKDPFPSPVSDSEFAATAPENVVGYLNDYHEYEYSIQNPTTVISSGGWNDSYTNWGDSKTMYDPCPPGWKVPSLNVWDKIVHSGSTILEPYSTPEAYYPPTGYVSGTEICEFDFLSYVYSSTSSESSNYAYLFRIPEYWTGTIDKDYGLAVRCMKDMSGVSGGGNDYVVDDEYEWEE